MSLVDYVVPDDLQESGGRESISPTAATLGFVFGLVVATELRGISTTWDGLFILAIGVLVATITGRVGKRRFGILEASLLVLVLLWFVTAIGLI